MKKFAIILDEKNEKRVVPTNWLNDSSTILYWPKKINDIKRLLSAVVILALIGKNMK